MISTLLDRFVRRNPETVASFLEDMGVSVFDLEDFEDSSYGGRKAWESWS
jgi:hypothetical protein